MEERILYSEYFYEKGSKNTEVLEKNANEYSLSSLASFLLLYHYKKTAHPDFEKIAKRTALLFNNPQWLQFQLNHNGDYKSLEPVNVTTANLPEEKESPQEMSNEIPKEIPYGPNFVDETKNTLLEFNGTSVEKFNSDNEAINEPSPAEKNKDEDEQVEINSSNNIANDFHQDHPAEKETIRKHDCF